MMSVLRFVGHGSAIGLGLLAFGWGCSDPTAPVPQGAFNVTFGDAVGVGVTCPAKQPTAQVQVGAVGSAQFAVEVSGENNTSISCKVSKISGGYRVTGSIVKGTAGFYLNSVDVGENLQNEGYVSVSGANTGGKSYGPTNESTCTFNTIEVAEGRAWLSFECPHVETGSSENEQCSLYNGFVVFENCDT